LPYCLLMFEKEIILKEQLAARCLFQCSPARKLLANAGTLGISEQKSGIAKLCAEPLGVSIASSELRDRHLVVTALSGQDVQVVFCRSHDGRTTQGRSLPADQ
jgi:hypothetical protein